MAATEVADPAFQGSATHNVTYGIFIQTLLPGRISAPGPGRPVLVLMVLAVVAGSQKTDTTVPVPILG